MHREHESPRVLVVDNDVTFLDMATHALLRHGFDVVSTPRGGDAIDHVSRGFLPTVLIVGTKPGIDIVEFVDAISRLHSATCVVFLADSLASATGLRRHRRGAVIIKPFDMVDLVRAVHVMAYTPYNPTISRPSDSPLHHNIDGWELPIDFIRTVWPWIAALILGAFAWLVTDFFSRSVTR